MQWPTTSMGYSQLMVNTPWMKTGSKIPVKCNSSASPPCTQRQIGCESRSSCYFSHSSCFPASCHLSCCLHLLIRSSTFPSLPMTLLCTATGKPIPSQTLLFPLVLLLFSIWEYFFLSPLNSYLPPGEKFWPNLPLSDREYVTMANAEWWCFKYIWNKAKKNPKQTKSYPQKNW